MNPLLNFILENNNLYKVQSNNLFILNYIFLLHWMLTFIIFLIKNSLKLCF